MTDTGTYKCPQLFALVRCFSFLSHENSASDRIFPINCYLLDHGHSKFEKTLRSLRLVSDKICCFIGVPKFPVCRDLIFFAKCPHAKYVADIEEKECEKKEKSEKEN